MLAAILASAGLLLHFLFDGNTPDPIDGAGAAFVFFGAMSAAFALGPRRWVEASVFALIVGLVMSGIAWQVLRSENVWAGREFAFAAGVFAVVISLPLFQAQFHRTRFATDYKLTHFHVWTDAISGAGALAFTGLSWLMLLLLDQLLGLVGIDVIENLVREEWFGWVWSGGAFGTALGVLRNNLKIIGSLQNVVLIVLSLLAVPLALALAVFLVALAASGGQALWDATDAATPVLLTCAVGCFVLANSIVRDDGEAISRNRVLRVVGVVLAAGVLPLALFAAVSMGIRIDQHGLSPERIWGLIAVIVAVAYGLAYWAGLVRGLRKDWAARLRDANLHLAAATCVLALILALPLFDFGAISARQQVARLESGRVSAQEFDFTALRWDFGDAGRRALARLAEGEGDVAELATAALAQTERVWDWNRDLVGRGFVGTLRLETDDPALRGRVEAFLDYEPWRCADYCVALDLGELPAGSHRIALVQRYGYETVDLPAVGADGETIAAVPADPREVAAENPGPLSEDSVVEVREEMTRYIYVDGKKVGEPVDSQPMESLLITIQDAE
ncbi:DUF4153 domain-containing protein [Altererythrobacter sp. KTW20L]|nr:DUF4153 domain-containing protein [Altererythrobacter sp. KTW20L]